jgi:hypothetical protein
MAEDPRQVHRYNRAVDRLHQVGFYRLQRQPEPDYHNDKNWQVYNSNGPTLSIFNHIDDSVIFAAHYIGNAPTFRQVKTYNGNYKLVRVEDWFEPGTPRK